MIPAKSKKIIRAKVLGFCMGVHRAVEMTEGALAQSAANTDARSNIYTLGPLIHNPQVLSALFDQGVVILEEELLFSDSAPPKDLRGATVIIRAHGVSPLVEEKLCEKNAKIIDATCPRVKANQLAAQEKAKNGYRIFLAGEKDHAELKGIYSYALCGCSAVKRLPVDDAPWCVVVGNPEEAKDAALFLLEKESGAKTALIGQTTISEDEYKAIAQTIKMFFPNLDVTDTICGATRDRQNALRELCSRADSIIIIGGKDSANTRRLLSIAQECGKRAWLVENAAALPPLDAVSGIIGISAGASTPDNVIDEVEKALRRAG
jgi:4-hydroxy-3-methylbut-2-enyl diphosphate reductase